MAIRSLRAIALVATTLVLALAAGCSIRGSGYQYVRNRSTGTYLKVPVEWKVYDRTQLIKFLDDGSGSVAALRRRLPYVATFDGAEQPAISRFFRLDPDTHAPSGLVQVQALNDDEREGISIGVLRSVIVNDFDDELQSGQVKVSRYEDATGMGNFRGKHMVFTRLSKAGGSFTVDQTTLLDPATKRLYVLAIGCEPRCFDQNRKIINAVVTSWTIKES